MTSIENGPAQAPNPNNRKNASQVHPERVPSTLGGDTPVHPDYNPTHPNAGEINSIKNRNKYIIGGAAIMSALVAAGAYFGAKAGNESSSNPIESAGGNPNSEITENNFNNSDIDLEGNTATIESSPSVNYEAIDVSALTVDEFYSDSIYPEAYRIRWAHEELRSRQTPELIGDFLTILKNDKRLPDLHFVDIDFDNPKPINPSIENSGDEILFQQGLDRYTASIETDPNVGRKLLAGVITEEAGSSFDRQLAQVGDNQGEPIDAMYRVSRSDTTLPGQETDVFTQTAVADYVPNGAQSKFIKAFNPYDNSFSEIAVQFKENQWVTAYVILEDSSDWIMRPEDLSLN